MLLCCHGAALAAETEMKKLKQKTSKRGVSYYCYRVIRWLVWLFYPKIKVVGEENLPHQASIIVGNHSQMNGPICAELYFPGKRTIWCAGQMMQLKEVPAYAFEDFWSRKSKWTHPFYRVLSYLIAPISVCVFNNARTIPVYHDARLMATFKRTLAALQEDTNVVIYPECYTPHNHIVNQFQDKFVDVAKLHYKRTGQALSFVPMYVAPKLKTIYLGKPTVFCPEAPIEQERQRICDYLMNEITDMALRLPRHAVVPYANISKRDYPTNIPKEEEA